MVPRGPQLGLSAAQSIGAVLGGITAADIESGDAVKTMDLIWAVMKLEVLQGLDIPKMINMVRNPFAFGMVQVQKHDAVVMSCYGVWQPLVVEVVRGG